MTLENATPAEIPVVAALMNAAFRGSGAEAGWTTEAAYIDGDRTNAAMLEADVAARPGALLVARSPDDGTIVASAWLEPVGGGVWHLGSLVIAPGLQNAGLGRALLEAAERRAREQGARTIRMKVVHLRETLIAWYIRRGYLPTGETEPFPYHNKRVGVPRRDDLVFVVLAKTL